MHITKLGHCCLLIKTSSVTILTDPGTYSTIPETLSPVDIILITHEHADHFHSEAVHKVLANNPNAKIITNTAVGKLLAEAGVSFEVVEDGHKSDTYGVLIEGYGTKHATICEGWGQVENTGYFVDGKLFYPGDAFTNPARSVDVLALPVAGPWMKLSEAVEYAIALKPRIVFPVHDGILKTPSMMSRVFEAVLPRQGITFVSLNDGEQKEF